MQSHMHANNINTTTNYIQKNVFMSWTLAQAEATSTRKSSLFLLQHQRRKQSAPKWEELGDDRTKFWYKQAECERKWLAALAALSDDDAKVKQQLTQTSVHHIETKIST